MQNNPQLFCFTHAGGSAAFFNEIKKDMTGIEVVKLEYAGHGTRHKESFYYDFAELVEDMYPKIKEQYKGGKYGLFGYSMGSITLVEILKKIIEDPEMRLPACVFMSSHEPHAKSELLDFAEGELDEWVKERTIRFGGVPDNLKNNSVFWRMYLPLYRADYTIIGRYDFNRMPLRTEIPAVIFYSERDTPLSEMKQWKNYFMGRTEFFRFEGNHFFILEHHKEMATIIFSELQKIKETSGNEI